MDRKFTSLLSSVITSAALLTTSALSAFAAVPEPVIDPGQEYQAALCPPKDEMAVNDSIYDLDESIVKVMIDPGHFSKYNQSPVYKPYWESIMTLKLSNYLKTELEALGAHADLTKTELDEDPTLNERGFLSKGYDFFISVHSNAIGNSAVDMPIAFVYQNLPWTDIDDISAELGLLIAQKTAQVMGTSQKGVIQRKKGTKDNDRNGVMDDEWFGVLFASRYVETPGILMEHSFHTNYRSAVWLYNDDNLKLLAKEEAKVIFDYLSEHKVTGGVVLGDVNGDGHVDASDASKVLEEYSRLSTGGKHTFVARIRDAADIDRNGITDSADASAILAFYSYLSTGGEDITMESWSAEPD